VLLVSSLAAFCAADLRAACTAGAKLLRVPEDCATVADAVSALGGGGTIDIASGTYSFVADSGLDLGRKNKAMTLRARNLRQVTFTGGGQRAVARIENATGGGPAIAFEGIRFVNGWSANANRAGGVTLANAEASFVDCEFDGNRHVEATTGGGALGLYGASRATIVRTTFTDNTARNNGGAIFAVRNGNGPSSLWIQGSSFARNSTARSGFTRTAAGGAIYVRGGKYRIADTRFEDNLAGWVGGAIFGWGEYKSSAPYCDYDAATTDILITRSLFLDNHADDSANPAQVPQTQGGAIHTENCVRLRIYRSSFEGNSADWGGAVSVDHSETLVEQTSFRYNWATSPDSTGAYPIAGSFLSLNGDTGSQDHPTPAIELRRVLMQGGRPGQPTAPAAQLGGCLNVRGDTSKPSPVAASARVRTTITDSAFVDCGVGHLMSNLALIRGGAIDTNRADLRITNTLFARSRADGGGNAIGRGSGIALRDDSKATFSGNVVFAGGYADVPNDSPGDVDLYVLGSTTTGAVEEWAENPPATAGMLVAAPSLPAAPGGPFGGEAFLSWAYAGSSASLDGDSLGGAKTGSVEESEGGHQLQVSGLGSCARCSATVLSPVDPATTLVASPASIVPGGSSTLSWTTPDGTFLDSMVDRGLGEKPASGQATVTPGGTTTWRRLVLTAQGGALAEETVAVGGGGGGEDEIFEDGFNGGGFGAWDTVVN
jgi:predicted outer membrane repeat protein